MDPLNYRHLYHFWRIAREGGLSRAAVRLDVTHSTLSAQLKELEEFLGGSLFERRGKRLLLTPLGEDVAAHADDIFRLGAEIVDLARGRSTQKVSPLRIGVVGHLPKTIAYRLVEPATKKVGIGPLVARQGTLEALLDELAANRLHAVLADAPPPDASSSRLYAHPLGESSVLLYGCARLARAARRGFPRSLDGTPLLVPLARSSLRRQIDRWLVDQRVRPRIEGEFDDAGLMRVAGIEGLGLFPVRAALRSEVEDTQMAELVGPLTGVVERYYVISREARVRHAGVSALIDAARLELSGERP